MNSKKEIKNNYKQTGSEIGVFMVKNKANNKIFLGASMNAVGALNRCQFELKMKTHRNKYLMKDWLEFGSDEFSFDVIDTVEKRDDPNHDYLTELTDLLNVWLDEHKPFGDKGYNKQGHINIR